MRINNTIHTLWVCAALFGLGGPVLGGDLTAPAPSFNADRVLNEEVPDILPRAKPQVSAADSDEDFFISGANAYFRGDFSIARESFEKAADHGHPLAQWKLGRMYEEGDGVEADPVQAFNYYTAVAAGGGDEPPSSQTAPFVAYALVAVGKYYMQGIENSSIRANPAKARKIFRHAASFYGSGEAQYNLGLMYFDGVGGALDKHMAARWLKLAAGKGHHKAQALLGRMMFFGDGIPQRPTRGLMWLTIARELSKGKDDDWIRTDQERAFALATESERRTAISEAGQWTESFVAAQ